MTAAMDFQENISPLTRREIEVLSLAASGRTAKQTAAAMNISSDTVKFHIKNSLRKLSVENKTAAATKALSLGLFVLSDGDLSWGSPRPPGIVPEPPYPGRGAIHADSSGNHCID